MQNHDHNVFLLQHVGYVFLILDTNKRFHADHEQNRFSSAFQISAQHQTNFSLFELFHETYIDQNSMDHQVTLVLHIHFQKFPRYHHLNYFQPGKRFKKYLQGVPPKWPKKHVIEIVHVMRTPKWSIYFFRLNWAILGLVTITLSEIVVETPKRPISSQLKMGQFKRKK